MSVGAAPSAEPTPPSLSVCVCTFRRPARLAQLLDAVAAQSRRPDEIVVIDNDAAASARAVCDSHTGGIPLRYAVEPEQNISLARNRAVNAASGDWLALIDDDELAPPDWLERLLATAAAARADAVLGPVLPVLPADAPAWIRAGRFYDRRRFATGTPVPRNELRTSNLLIRRRALLDLPTLFDPGFGLSGGEDGELLTRVAAAGARMVWCDEAPVREPVEDSRLRLRWLLRRALRGGQDFGLHFLAGRYGEVGFVGRLLFAAKATAALLVSLPLALLSLPAGRHRAVTWLRRAWAQVGKLLAFSGYRVREYAVVGK